MWGPSVILGTDADTSASATALFWEKQVLSLGVIFGITCLPPTPPIGDTRAGNKSKVSRHGTTGGAESHDETLLPKVIPRWEDPLGLTFDA
jgi:hypothetical protein